MHPKPITMNDSDRVAPDHRIHFPSRTHVRSRRRIAAGVLSVLLGLSWGVIGIDTDATADQVALGGGTATGEEAVAIGDDAVAPGLSAIAIGRDSVSSGRKSTAVGSDAHAGGNAATAVGRYSVAYGQFATTLGALAKAHGQRSQALGPEATAIGDETTAVGYRAMAAGPGGYTLGSSLWPCAYGEKSLNHWSCSRFVTADQRANPKFNSANAQERKDFHDKIRREHLQAKIALYIVSRATALGSRAAAAAEGTVAVGWSALATGTNSIALGRQAMAFGTNSIAIGSGVTAGANEVVVGARGHSYKLPGLPDTTTFSGNKVVTVDKYGKLHVGGIYTQAGTTPTGTALRGAAVLSSDVTVRDRDLGTRTEAADYERAPAIGSGPAAPASAEQRRVVVQDTNRDGSVRLRTLDLGDLSGLDRRVTSLSERLNKATAMSSALSALPNVVPGDNRFFLGVGAGHYSSEQALAIGMSARIESRVFVNAGMAVASGDTVSVRGGVGVVW